MKQVNHDHTLSMLNKLATDGNNSFKGENYRLASTEFG